MKKTFRKTALLMGAITLCGGMSPLVAVAGIPEQGVLEVQQQQKKVTGTVSDAMGPIIGASVVEKGTGNGAVTDLDGRFSLTVRPGSTLVVSYVGYEKQELKVGAGSNIDITLREDSHSLEEVVVVGYGVQKKKLVTGATAQVKGEDIARLNTTNPLQAMQGQTPGVNIQSTSGQPGSSMKVQIRGLGTVGNSGPLYLIDGIGGDISTLNPADIESIDVLKDAASAAIYGAQAANGVVLITTKSGKEGRADISLDAYYGWQNVARKADLLNSQQYMEIMNEQQANSGLSLYDFASMKSIYDPQGNLYDTNWIDQMFKDNASVQSYNLGISGGNKLSTYAMSLGYMAQEGVVGGKDVSNYERYNFRINSEHKVIDRLLKVGEQVSFVYNESTGISVGNQYSNTLRGAFGTSPLAPVWATDSYAGSYADATKEADFNSYNGFYGSPYNATDNSDWYKYDGNPYGSMMTNTNNLSKNATFNGNVFAELTPLKGLTLRTVFGAVYSTSDYRGMGKLYHFSQYSYSDTRTSASQSKSHGLTMTWTNTAQYDWNLGDHALSALVGMESSRYEGAYVSAGNAYLKEGFDTWARAYVSNGTAASTSDGLSASGAPNDDSRTVSYFGRLSWNWQEKYLVTATVRRDGSSRFASGHRFGTFPSVSAGWVLTNEEFLKPAEKFVDYLKLRASWGQVGNQNISNYQYLAPIKTTNTHYLFGNSAYDDANSAALLGQYWGAFPSRIANPELKWETSEQFNVGLDTRMLGGHLNANFDFYIKTTKDWLVVAPIFATAGTGAPFINGGDVKNTGFEFNLTWNDNIGRDFHYNVGFNGAFNKNKVGNIPNTDGIIHGSVNMLYDNSPEFYRAQDGHAIGYFWGFKTAGIFQNQQEIDNWVAAGNGVLQGTAVRPGDVKYYDIDHNGVIDDNDKVDLGNGIPDFTYGFNLGFDYKGIDFSVQTNGAAGHQIVQTYRNHANAQANYTTEILQRWTGEGTSDRIPRVTTTNVNWQFSDLYVHDADYLRISSVTLGYDLSRIWKSKYCRQLRLYVQAQNICTFTKYNGMDPEIGYGTDGWVSGVDVGYYPRPRTLLIGANVKF